MKKSSSSALALLFVCLPALAFGASLDYGSGSAGDTYSAGEASAGYAAPAANDGYGTQARTKCTPYFETVYNDRCESYTDRVCRTNQKESCRDVPTQQCRAVSSSRQVRKCFNVTELLCNLKEEVKYETVQVGFTVQKCHKVTERVCDTVYGTAHSTRDDFQCVTISNPVCVSEEHTVYDKTCRTTTSFDCQEYPVSTTDSYDSGDSYSSGGQQDSGYGAGDSGYGGGEGGYGSGSDSYAAPAPTTVTKCNRKQDTKCYKTPRTVTVPKCSSRNEKACEKLTETVPVPDERQNCHNEERKVCELEERHQPKQVKKYVYTKQCRSAPKRVCENADSKKLVPSCVSSAHKECSYRPEERCDDVPKKHCYKVANQVRKERCETVYVPTTTGYTAPAATSQGYSAPSGDSYSAPAGDSYSAPAATSGDDY